MANETEEITRVLKELRNQPELFNEKLFPLLYEAMKSMARAQLRKEGSARTIQPTALVHEAYIKLAGSQSDWQNRGHFLACAANAMRQILVDYARKRTSQKRGGSLIRVELGDYSAAAGAEPLEHVLAVDEALDRLKAFDPLKSELLKLKFFGGLSIPEAAKVMGIGLTAAKDHVRSAQAWMNRELGATSPK